MKKLIVSSLALSLLLVGCSNEEKHQTDNKPAEFGKTLSNGKHFLSIYNSDSKNINPKDKVDEIAYVNDGKITMYNLRNSSMNLDYISKQDDNDLLKKIKRESKKSFENDREFEIESNKLLANIAYKNKEQDKLKEAEKDLKNVESLKYVEPKAHNLKLEREVKNKKTNKELMMLYNNPITLMSMNQEQYEKSLNKTTPHFFDETIKTKKIGESKFSGLQTKLGNEKKGKSYNKVVMKVGENKSKVIFDKPNTKSDYIDTFNMD